MKINRSFYEQSTLMLPGSCLASTWCESIRMVQPSAGLSRPKPMSAPKTKRVMRHAGEPHGRRLFGPAGHAYVYLVYGFHHMLNIVTEDTDFPAAVLIRAVEPVRGIALMKKRRAIEEPRQLASGPGKLCEAFAIDRG